MCYHASIKIRPTPKSHSNGSSTTSIAIADGCSWKPSFNISLLSGGEKATTAVALLLAIFQFRPSPFCSLDEVDTPFDEANIGRFISVLHDYLNWTKLVIVTHSNSLIPWTTRRTLCSITGQAAQTAGSSKPRISRGSTRQVA